MTIASRVLTVHKETLWHDEVKEIFCAGHRDVE